MRELNKKENLPLSRDARRLNRDKINRVLIYCGLFIAVFAVFYITSPKNTPYNYFTRLAFAFIHHRLYLLSMPRWLNEFAYVNGRYYVVYPPMPSILLLPFVYLFGPNFSQVLFSIILGSINPLIMYSLLRRIKISLKTALLCTVFFALGTDYWYLTTVGSAWFLAHIVALFFLLLALRETFGKKRLFLIGLLLGASYWSRSTEIFTIGFFLYYMRDKFWPVNKKNILNLFYILSGLFIFVALDSAYNFVRFGDISPLMPYEKMEYLKYLATPFLKNGFLNISHIPVNLKAFFLSVPSFQSKWPFMIPSLYSLAIWFTSPALLLLFKVKRQILVTASLLAIIPCFFAISLWPWPGYAQFGYRFAQDFMPFLVIMLSLAIGQKPKGLSYALVFLSIVINLWGIIMLNFLNIWVI